MVIPHSLILIQCLSLIFCFKVKVLCHTKLPLEFINWFDKFRLDKKLIIMTVTLVVHKQYKCPCHSK